MHKWNPEQYVRWLPEAGLAAWIRTTWLPYTELVTESEREETIQEIASEYASRFPADAAGKIHVKMVRLEVEALKR